jgi:hypothetical protein
MKALHGLHGGRVDPESQARRKAHGPQHPEMVFMKPDLGIADGADHSIAEVVAAAYKIENLILAGIE